MHSNSDSPSRLELASLTIEGPDAAAFLQAQLTADVDAMVAGRWFPAAWCDPKGRVLAVMLVLPADEAFTVALPASLLDTIQRRLTMFRIGREVTISVGRGLGPTDRGAALAWNPERRLGPRPDRDSPGPSDRSGGTDRDIDDGVPWILPQTSGEFLPQMLDLERLGGLSYRKGCYPGQEVVARVHYRGRVTRRLARFERSGAAPEPGETIDLGDASGVVLYAIGPGPDRTTSRGLMIVPADARPGGDDPAEGASWAMVDSDHTVLPSGP